jgi:predicted GIY-YIG superfamily endonuclease
MFTVYLATNKLNGKRYIGVTGKGMGERRSQHEANARRGREGKLYDDLRKYGPRGFVWTVLCAGKPVICVNDGRTFASQSEAARFYGLPRNMVGIVCRGDHNTTFAGPNLVFKFLEM